nr:phage terminase small subunit P27 family [Bradyrhizobium sp. 6(2017)]QIG99114.1 phage terminase small subunit P27 family [Bradyrhizobium sp. 6(2017)]
MKGRRPAPTHLKLVKGNPGKRPLNSKEPKARRSRPSAPLHLSDKARETWGYVTGLLDRMGVLTEADGVALEMLCEAYADFLAARAELKSIGSDYYTTETAGGDTMHRVHPAVAQRNDADRRIRAWLAEFGMTPSARARVKADGQTEEDPAASYFEA